MNFRDVFRTLAAGTVAVACMSVASGQDEFPTVTSDVTFDDDGNIAIDIELQIEAPFTSLDSIDLYGGTELPLPATLAQGRIPEDAEVKQFTPEELIAGQSWKATHQAGDAGNPADATHYWLFASVTATVDGTQSTYHLSVGYWKKVSGLKDLLPWPK